MFLKLTQCQILYIQKHKLNSPKAKFLRTCILK